MPRGSRLPIFLIGRGFFPSKARPPDTIAAAVAPLRTPCRDSNAVACNFTRSGRFLRGGEVAGGRGAPDGRHRTPAGRTTRVGFSPSWVGGRSMGQDSSPALGAWVAAPRLWLYPCRPAMEHSIATAQAGRLEELPMGGCCVVAAFP